MGGRTSRLAATAVVGALALASQLTMSTVAGAQSGPAATAATAATPGTPYTVTKVGTSYVPPASATPSAPTGQTTPQADRVAARNAALTNRSSSRAAANAPTYSTPVVKATPVAGDSTALTSSYQGLDSYQSAAADYFGFTPPDQGLCAGNGAVGEVVNDTFRYYSQAGTPITDFTSLNKLLALPPMFDQTTGRYGPSPSDPSCLYDHQGKRWIFEALVLDQDPKSGNLTLGNQMYVAVSRTSSPTGAYDIYRWDTTDTNAGPRHVSCPCLGDYPHIGIDQYGIYVTTNEYPWTGPGTYGNGFNGAQLYAVSKAALERGDASTTGFWFQDTALESRSGPVPGFTLWPANVPGTAFDTSHGGSEYFMSSTAAAEANPSGTFGSANQIGLYRLDTTSSLDTAGSGPRLTRTRVYTENYGEAPYSVQKNGPVPLADCLDTNCRPGVGPSNEVEGPLDPSDTRPLTLWYAGGHLQGALDTVMQVGGNVHAGVAWFSITPGASVSTSALDSQGYVGVAGNNAIYPSIATDSAGNGTMNFTLAGDSHFPSSAYVPWGPSGPTGSVLTSGDGAAPLDDFCEYTFYDCAGTSPPASRPRYGDYSAATYDAGQVFFANEYVASACNFATYNQDATCGGTRSRNSNWSTHIASVATP